MARSGPKSISRRKPCCSPGGSQSARSPPSLSEGDRCDRLGARRGPALSPTGWWANAGARHRPNPLDGQGKKIARARGRAGPRKLARSLADTAQIEAKAPMNTDNALDRASPASGPGGARGGGEGSVPAETLLPGRPASSALFQQHGLGQTLACMQMRAKAGRWSLQHARPANGPVAAVHHGGFVPVGAGGDVHHDSQFYREASEQAWLFIRRPAPGPGGIAMNWPWRMPQYLPWATPYPLPRDTSEGLMAEGHCENFGLLLERYLAYGDNRGQLELLRELTDRRALVPDFTGQGVDRGASMTVGNTWPRTWVRSHFGPAPMAHDRWSAKQRHSGEE